MHGAFSWCSGQTPATEINCRKVKLRRDVNTSGFWQITELYSMLMKAADGIGSFVKQLMTQVIQTAETIAPRMLNLCWHMANFPIVPCLHERPHFQVNNQLKQQLSVRYLKCQSSEVNLQKLFSFAFAWKVNNRKNACARRNMRVAKPQKTYQKFNINLG